MESPKPNHAKIKAGKHIFKIDGGQLGLLGFNNMIPIHDEALIEFNFSDELDSKYAELLRRQAAYINRHKTEILDHASRTYYDVVRKANKFLLGISCNFKKLERACDNYDPKKGTR